MFFTISYELAINNSNSLWAPHDFLFFQGDLTDPTSCPFVGMDCKDPDSTTCRSLCTSVNIGGVSAACASLHAGLCVSVVATCNKDQIRPNS